LQIENFKIFSDSELISSEKINWNSDWSKKRITEDAELDIKAN